jgi:membrane fusion protein, heavy metal efflux system
MKKSITIITIFTVIFFSIFTYQNSARAQHEHGHGAKHAHEPVRGPHRGRMLIEGEFALELQIFETGVPPQFRIYGYYNDIAISPSDFSAQVSLKRLGQQEQQFVFRAITDFLSSDMVVNEPHSFDVDVSAEFKGKKYSWKFDSYEGRTVIPDGVAEHSGIKTELAQTRQIRTLLRTRGKVLPSEHKIAHIIPRFSGLAREGRKHIGDRVEKGEILAIIESNESLQPFEVRSPIAGMVINGHVISGEFVAANQSIYIVADLSDVWVDFFVPLSEHLSINNAQRILITDTNVGEVTEARITYIAPYADERTQSQLIRAEVDNDQGKFLPGMFVTGDLIVNEAQARVTVKKSALQKFRDWDVVFIKVGDTYEIKPLTLGKSDDVWVEVLDGLQLGEEYVSSNSYLIKADILKSGASHDH